MDKGPGGGDNNVNTDLQAGICFGEAYRTMQGASKKKKTRLSLIESQPKKVVVVVEVAFVVVVVVFALIIIVSIRDIL